MDGGRHFLCVMFILDLGAWSKVMFLHWLFLGYRHHLCHSALFTKGNPSFLPSFVVWNGRIDYKGGLRPLEKKKGGGGVWENEKIKGKQEHWNLQDLTRMHTFFPTIQSFSPIHLPPTHPSSPSPSSSAIIFVFSIDSCCVLLSYIGLNV